MVEEDLAPGLLLAAPALGDQNFRHTVVLLGHHDDGGAMGWVINGDELPPVGELLASSGLLAAGRKPPATAAFARAARVGGPVSPQMGWLVYARDAVTLPGEIAVGPELGVTGDRDALAAVLRGDGPQDFRLLIGYAGWGPGQLEDEIRAGAWLPAPVDAALIFETAEDRIWHEAYRRAVGTAPAAFTSRSGMA